MYIKQDFGFNDLMDKCWSGAIDTLKTIEEHDKEEELMAHLEEQWFDEVPTMTAINDYLWMDSDFVFECLGISEDEEEEEEETDIDFSFYRDFDTFCEDRRCEECPLHSYRISKCEEEFERLKTEYDNANT